MAYRLGQLSAARTPHALAIIDSPRGHGRYIVALSVFEASPDARESERSESPRSHSIMMILGRLQSDVE